MAICGPHGGPSIARITTAGVITDFPTDDSGSGPSYIAAGPDGNLWYSAITERIPGSV